MADQIFSVNAGFFDAIDYDRTYSADDMNKPYSRVVADGVFATNSGDPSSDLQVISAGAGMNITVQSGQGIFGHKWFENPSSIAVTVPANTTLYTRIDSVLVQIDKRQTGRVGNIVYRTGTPSSDAVPPDINTVANVIEYRLANIEVASGTNSIGNQNITDLRGSSACPWVTGLIQQVDTSTLWEQYRAAYQAYYNAQTVDFEQYKAQQRESWEEFISTLTQDLTVTTSVVVRTSVYSATGEATNIPINIASYNPDTDVLQVFINGMLLIQNTDYTVSNDNLSITLANAIQSGNTVNFLVFKSLIGANIESTVAMMQRLDNNITAFMSDSGWVELPLADGITAYDADNVPAYRCIGNRFYLRGAVKGVIDSGTTICTLPIPYRPEEDHIYSTVAFNSSGLVNDDLAITISATDRTVKATAKSGTIEATDKISIATCFVSSTGNTVNLIYDFKGNVNTYANLPTSGMNAGDVYMVLTADPTHYIAAGDNVMWNGTGWEVLQAVISSAEIDAIINSVE